MQSISKENGGFKYLLIAIDVFSRYAYGVPKKSKSVENLVKGLKELFKQAKARPLFLEFDRGKEFLSQPVRDLFRKHEIKFFTADTNTEHKTSIAERLIRTLKNRLYKY